MPTVPDNNAKSGIYSFGPFEAHDSERRLLRNGVAVPLAPKAFDLLLLLVQNPGRILSKDELMRHIWADSFVEEANLTVNISALRKALGDARYIETVPKFGYRFVATVVEAHSDMPGAGKVDALSETTETVGEKQIEIDEAGPFPVGSSQDPALPHAAASQQTRRRLRLVAIVSLALIAATILISWSGSKLLVQSGDSAVSPITSIAVLPLDNGTQDPSADYLSDGITETLRNRLSRLSGLRVASRNSSFRYKDKDKDLYRIAGELNVSAVLTGSVRQLGDDLIIIISLDDGRADRHVWGAQYVRKSDDILTLQDEIARDVTKSLSLELTGADQDKLNKTYTRNAKAYELYLKGNYEWNKHRQEDVEKAIKYYEQALEIDPNYALAYAGLSGSYGYLGNVYLRPIDCFPKARAYAAKALELDDSIAHAHTAMGAVKLLYDWDWAGQETEFKRAQELDPDLGDAHQLYAGYLESAGRFKEARDEAKKALALDPLSSMFGSEVGFTYYYSRQYDEAIEQFEETLNLDPVYGDAYQYLGQSFEQKGMYAQAIAAFQKGIAQGERSPALISSLGHAYAMSGDRSGALKCLAELNEMSKRGYTSPYFAAVVYAGIGDKDRAFEWLQKALEDRSFLLLWLNVEPQFDPIRSDQRFEDVVKRIGIR